MTTINNYSVSLSMDASQYVKSGVLARNETAKLYREINKARTPLDNYERSVRLLDKAFKEGAISQQTYTALLAKQKAMLSSTAAAAKTAATSTQTFTQALKSQALALGSAYAGMAGFSRAIGITRDRMQELDTIAKSSRAIGENTDRLQGFQIALSEMAGVGGDEAINMLTKLTKTVGEASVGLGRGAKWFKVIGVNVQEIKDLSPVQQFEAVADAIRQLDSQSLKVAASTAVFSDQGAKLIPVMESTAAAYKASADQVYTLNLAISDTDVAKIEATNDAIARLGLSIKGLTQSAASGEGLSQTIDLMSQIVALASKLNSLGQMARSSDPNALFKILQSFGLRVQEQGYNKPSIGLLPKGSLTAESQGNNYLVPKPSTELKDKRLDNLFPSKMETAIGSAIDSGFEKLRSSGGMFGNLLSTFGSAAGMIGMAGAAQTKELVTALQESPAIASIELGSQEAYQMLNKTTTDAAAEQAREAANQKILAENAKKQRDQMNTYLDRINQALEANGFQRIR